MSAKGGKTPTTKMKEVKSMAKKIGIIVLLCFSLCVGGVSAFANEGHDETDTQTLIETQPPVSSVLFRQDGADIQQSTDEGKTWQSYSPIEETDYFTYDEFSAWIENETENIQKLVDAGEWTEAEATEALEYYDEILKSILEGKMVGKRASSSDDQLFFSMPDNAQPEQYQTFVFDGNTYKSIGPFDTEEELFNALKEYTDTEVEAGTAMDTDQLKFEGYLCKKPVLRKTPFSNRTVCDCVLAINDRGMSYYVPCICWSKNAKKMAQSAVGDKFYVSGRLQSREYVKNEKTYVINEVSIYHIDEFSFNSEDD